METADFARHEARETIIEFLRVFDLYGFQHTQNIKTLQFLRSRVTSLYQVHHVAFRDQTAQTWDFRFLLYRSRKGSWSIIEYAGDQQQIASFGRVTPTPDTYPYLYLSESTVAPQAFALPEREKTLQNTIAEENLLRSKKMVEEFLQRMPGQQETQGEQPNPFYPFVAYGEVVDRGFDICRVRLVDPHGLILEDTVESGLVLFVSPQRVLRPLQAELYNRSGKLISQQTVLNPFPVLP